MRLGIDVGGTHTDAVLLDGQQVVASTKALTTANVRDGVIAALDAVLAGQAPAAGLVEAVMIGTTQFTNAVISRKGPAPTAVIRIALPSGEMIPPMTDWPPDLADALGRHVFMVHGGFTYDGYPIAPLDEAEVDAAIRAIAGLGIRQIAVSGVFSPANPAQEIWVAERIRKVMPDASVTLSYTIGQMGMLERENAALLNASLLPLARDVVASFRTALDERGIACPFYISQNDGTLMSAEFAAAFPALTFSSGPTNSLRGACLLTGLKDAVVVDVGGTTSDIGVLQDGFPRQSNIAISVGGVRTNFRMPDIQAIGLGGGSLVREEGASIGPDSVGYALVTEGLVFGGQTLTSTDIAVAAGRGQVGKPELVADLSNDLVAAALTTMDGLINDGIEQMKSSPEPVPVILVGGGAFLVSRSLPSASEIVAPEHAGVANAIGAANAQVGSETEQIVSYRQKPRSDVIDEITAQLTARLVGEGADPATIKVADIEETSLSYMAEATTRIRVKLVGDLRITRGGRAK